jgi:hypothetical protein
LTISLSVAVAAVNQELIMCTSVQVLAVAVSQAELSPQQQTSFTQSPSAVVAQVMPMA